MSDEIRKLIAASLARNQQHAGHVSDGEMWQWLTDFLLRDLHAAGYEIVPTWSDNLGAAPRDGTLIDVWCVPPDDDEFKPKNGGIRLPDVSWHEADNVFPYTGWTRVLDDGHWDLVESEPVAEWGLPRWIVTHWRPRPTPPKES